MPKPLTSWKEIAQYLGKGVRTVQRWEAAYGLPVRRLREGDHKAIVALPEELDAWLGRHSTTEESELDGLRRELEDLRAENARLKNRLLLTNGHSRPRAGFTRQVELCSRASRLIAEVTVVAASTRETIARTQMLCANGWRLSPDCENFIRQSH